MGPMRDEKQVPACWHLASQHRLTPTSVLSSRFSSCRSLTLASNCCCSTSSSRRRASADSRPGRRGGGMQGVQWSSGAATETVSRSGSQSMSQRICNLGRPGRVQACAVCLLSPPIAVDKYPHAPQRPANLPKPPTQRPSKSNQHADCPCTPLLACSAAASSPPIFSSLLSISDCKADT